MYRVAARRTSKYASRRTTASQHAGGGAELATGRLAVFPLRSSYIARLYLAHVAGFLISSVPTAILGGWNRAAPHNLATKGTGCRRIKRMSPPVYS